MTLRHGFFDGAAEVAAADAVFNGDVAGIFFAINFRGAIADVYRGELRQRDSFAGGREQANIFDGLFGVAIVRLITDSPDRSAARLEDLADGFAADGGFYAS